ncbi:MAG: DNA-directed DNA polymerase II small subunit [Candidatus Thermoplasmatota archaeon]|nr:DNA-directed DNA polymerase II small subunit [Candidatus Thermoplasmatota archaeon]
MKTILKLFSGHGTFVQPDALTYILSKEHPQTFTQFILDNLKEYPFILTLEQIKTLEQADEPEKLPLSPNPVLVNKELQTKILSTMYGSQTIHIPPADDADLEYDDPDKDDQIVLPSEKQEKSTAFSDIDVKKVKGWKPKARDYESEVHVTKDITGNSTCEGTTSDFTKLFVNRYQSLRKILQTQRRELVNVMPIDRIKRNGVKEVQIIGIVKAVKTTVNGHRLIELEDETGVQPAIALKNNREAMALANEALLDEIIGIRGQLSKNGDLLIVHSIVFPDVSIQNQRHKADVPVYAAFLSDIHIGSNKFMKDEWRSFLRWITGGIGNSRQKDVASKIKYLVLPGDLVDGIGVYPGQEQELDVANLYEQYETLAKQLEFIPGHITMIMQPGNHDAVRPAEPQPTFEKEVQQLFSGKEFIFVGNPCYFSLHGVEILSYHGVSLLDYATSIQHLNYNQPTEVMKVMLKKRHLAPVYGGYTPLAPEHLDHMVIDKVPDIFVTGHVHTANIDKYRGVTLINASAWQAQTSYQKMLNFVPDSAKLPIVDLKSGNVTMMDFSKAFS